MKSLKITIFCIFVILLSFTSVTAKQLEDSFIVVNDVNGARQDITNSGGNVKHTFLEDKVLIGKVPEGIESRYIDSIFTLDSQNVPERYQTLFEIFRMSKEQPLTTVKKNVGLEIDDMFYEEPMVLDLNSVQEEDNYSPGYYDTSLYMIGDVSVSIITPESIGGTEDWTDGELIMVHSEIMRALDWWAEKEPKAHLNFVYNYEDGVPVEDEPIENGHNIMFNQAMDYLGFGVDGDLYPATSLVYDYVNYQRDLKNTDWGFAIFVADSTNDEDDKFPSGYFAYVKASASGNGPYMVMTSENGGYGLENMDAVTAHEFGHVFGALDQYTGCSCTTRTGYLNYENQNCGYGTCLINEISIMKNIMYGFNNNIIDDYARGQVGWQDLDNNGVLDILDGAAPKVQLVNESNLIEDPITREPTLEPITSLVTQDFTLEGEARKSLFESLNPNYNNVSISDVEKVQFRIVRSSKPGEWIDINHFRSIVDGVYLIFKDVIDYPTKPGTYKIQFRAVDRFGVATDEDSYAEISLPAIISSKVPKEIFKL